MGAAWLTSPGTTSVNSGGLPPVALVDCRALVPPLEHADAAAVHTEDRPVTPAECGLASAVPFPDGMARYEHQFNRRSHHHMVCTECGASVEFFSPEVTKIEEEIGHKYRFDATRHNFQIYGVCEDCRKKDRRIG